MTARDLLGRDSECAALDELVASVRAGPSRALVLRGEAGVGKSALLGYLLQHAQGCGIARAAGVESEMELAALERQATRLGFADLLSVGDEPEEILDHFHAVATSSRLDGTPDMLVRRMRNAR